MKKLLLLTFTCLLFLSGLHLQAQDPQLSVTTVQSLVFKGDSVDIIVKAPGTSPGITPITINSQSVKANFSGGLDTIKIPPSDVEEITVQHKDLTASCRVRKISGWWSIVPPLIAIIFALVFREVVPSLVLGVFSGTLLVAGLGFTNVVEAFKKLIDTHVLNALADGGHMSIIIFSMIIGGMVAVISKNGGMAGIVDALSSYARSARSSQMVTWLLGIFIFFDDYANTLVVGNTMRPVTDKFRVSREKLAYIVDSTAAPVAAIAFITTWIGAELGYIGDAIKPLNEITEGPYSIFLNSLKYAYYPVFTLVFMLFLIVMKRDFGPMAKAERRARKMEAETDSSNALERELEEIQPKKDIKHRWYNALIPILTVIIITVFGLFYTGGNASADNITQAKTGIEPVSFQETWTNLKLLQPGLDLSGMGAEAIKNIPEISFIQKLGIIIGNSDSYQSLLWSSLAGLMAAIFLSLGQRLLTVQESFEATLNGFKAMLPAFVILTLAWALASVTEELHTADFLTSIFSDSISPMWMAGITFILAAIVSFSTGSSWGTMAILYPLIIPAVYAVCQSANLPHAETMEIIYNVVSVVLAGSVLGDHCSPISDTTILSSMATQCNHVAHVRTQLPYATVVGGISLLVCFVFVNIGIPWYLNYLIGFGILFVIVRYGGKSVEGFIPQAIGNTPDA